MIIFMFCMLVLSIGVSCLILDDTGLSRHIPFDCDLIGMLLALFGGITVAVCLLIMLIVHCAAADAQGKWFVRYNNLQQRIQNIDQYDKTEVIKEIDEWNADYIEQQYGKQSPWTNWFYPLDISEFSTLSLHENGGQKQ